MCLSAQVFKCLGKVGNKQIVDISLIFCLVAQIERNFWDIIGRSLQ